MPEKVIYTEKKYWVTSIATHDPELPKTFKKQLF